MLDVDKTQLASETGNLVLAQRGVAVEEVDHLLVELPYAIVRRLPMSEHMQTFAFGIEAARFLGKRNLHGLVAFNSLAMREECPYGHLHRTRQSRLSAKCG